MSLILDRAAAAVLLIIPTTRSRILSTEAGSSGRCLSASRSRSSARSSSSSMASFAGA
uniref:Ubiquitin-activating enzyme E1 domain-containing protein 1 n=1 Tax=Arundo donax TaxID=35708 RepID=A0A0A9FIR8_ARUDO